LFVAETQLLLCLHNPVMANREVGLDFHVFLTWQ